MRSASSSRRCSSTPSAIEGEHTTVSSSHVRYLSGECAATLRFVPTRNDERSSRLFKQTTRYLSEATQLGNRVRELRARRKWTLEKAAEAMNLDLKHLQKVEAGELNVTMVTLVRIADGLDVPLAALFRAARRTRRAE